MNKFYLVRHGNIIKLPGDPGLSEIGIKNAKLTGDYLKDKNISLVYASPLRRTQETANYIIEKLGIKIITDIRLRERLNWGDRPNQSFEEFTIDWDKTINDRNFKPDYGSSSKEAGDRLVELIEELDKTNQNKNILLVTSGGVTADLLRNLFTENEVRKYVPNFPHHALSECSITIIGKDNNQYFLLECNNTQHLTD